MNYPLAVFAPFVGARSETFIQRHMLDLLPNRTAVVTGTASGPYGGHWKVSGPLLETRKLTNHSLTRRLVAASRRRLRFSNPSVVENSIKKFLKDNGVRVVLGEYLNLSAPYLKLSRELGLDFFVHAHGFDVSECLREAEWRMRYLEYREATGIIAMSQNCRAKLIDLGLPQDKIHVVPYGVEVSASPRSRPHRDVVSCVAVGRMVPKKAPILTLDAFRRALAVEPRLRLNYVGTGELLPAARQFIHAFELGDYVSLHGALPNDEVLKLMNEADIFIQHSVTDFDTGDEEGLPVGILEAMAHSLPVVSTRHAGIPEAVVEGGTGYLVDEGDSKAMASHLIELARDAELRKRFGHAGWRRAHDQFSWQTERTNLLSVLGLNGR